MSQNKSSRKRIRLTKRNTLRNKYYKTSIKNLIKTLLINLKLFNDISSNSLHQEKLKKILSLIYSILDKGNQKNVFHRNYVARKKSQLTIHCSKVLKI